MQTNDWFFDVEMAGPCPTQKEALDFLAAMPATALDDPDAKAAAVELVRWAGFFESHPEPSEDDIMRFGFGVVETGALLPVVRAKEGRKSIRAPKTAGYRICIQNGCGKLFWSQGAHVRCCPQHRS
jgi:hypothetical protein